MGITTFPAGSSGASDYTYLQFRTASSVATVLQPGNYEFVTDSTQNFTAGLTHTNGYITPIVFRGGRASIYLPLASVNLSVTSATAVPITIGYKTFTRTVAAAPTSASVAWATAYGSNAAFALNFTFTPPAGVTNMMAYYRDGSTQFLAITSSTDNVTINAGALPSAGSTITVRLAACDAYGVPGDVTAELTSGPRPTFNTTVITSTQNITFANNTNFVESWVVGGGGGGGTAGGNDKPGGGGGGAVTYAASTAVTPGSTHTITIGAAGTAGNGSNKTNGNTGGTSSFGNLRSAVGGGGGASSPNVVAGNGGCGGGAAGTAPGDGATNNYGNANVGFRGGAGWKNNAGGQGAGGGGGGMGSVGNAAPGPTTQGGNGGNGYTIANAGITVAGGAYGSGGSNNGTGGGSGSYGGGGNESQSGGPGYVLLRYNS